ncbi:MULTISPECIES: hypothetical protein [Actinomadura]|uniref:Uncharacterized protein n=1 Tax=Actinomadura yumaensis TaxID=111807 RepID=A0ABW2CPC7_9ACTN|nr:hypothetical protein [Actinomadura sp. J1-007]MWK39023.1 hypothetical protein [Actinomadura sp. J1-007]
MKSTRAARRARRSFWARIAGYGGALLLAAAAVVVLIRPAVNKDAGSESAGAETSTAPSATAGAGPGGAGVPGYPGPSAAASNPATQQTRGGSPYPGGQGGGGGGPAMPGQNGSGAGISWCPAGTASYRAATGGLEVSISVSGSGAVRAEVTARGRSPEPQQATVRGGKPHKFLFRGVAPQSVERVRVTTVSVGVSMQTCYARPSA